jgi:hypothetical protein
MMSLNQIPSFAPDFYIPYNDPTSAQLIRCLFHVEYTSLLLPPNAIILQHPAIDPCVFAFKFQHWFRCHGFENEMIVAVRAVLV